MGRRTEAQVGFLHEPTGEWPNTRSFSADQSDCRRLGIQLQSHLRLCPKSRQRRCAPVGLARDGADWLSR